MEQNEYKRALGPKDSLVHYNMPELITKRLPKDAHVHALTDIPMAQDSDRINPSMDKMGSTEEILDIIFPPRQWEENGQLWKQTVSSDPVTAEGIAELSERLDKWLHEQEAKEDGIDAVRAKLFGQFFNEIIRIETVICGERGLLLGKLRDDHKYTMAVYRKLYESCMAYAMRKSLQAEKKDKDEAQYLMTLIEENLKIQEEIAEVKKQTSKFQLAKDEERNTEMMKHADALESLKVINQEMKDQLKTVLKPKRQQ